MPNTANQESITVILLRIIGSLALVVGLIAAISFCVSRSGIFKQNNISATSQTPSMSVLEALSTGQNCVILLIKCEEQVFVVGQTSSNYTLLKELNSEVSKKIIESKAGNETVGSFKKSLSNFMQNIKIQSAGSERPA
jgi:flagellar biogenesis protein FliO